MTVCVADPARPCSVITQEPVAAGQLANFTCIMQYIAYLASSMTTSPTLAFDAACGGPGTSTHTLQTSGGRLETYVEYTTTGCEVPACTCTATFSFTDPGTGQTFATNDVTYTCTTEAVSSTYLLVILRNIFSSFIIADQDRLCTCLT